MPPTRKTSQSAPALAQMPTPTAANAVRKGAGLATSATPSAPMPTTAKAKVIPTTRIGPPTSSAMPDAKAAKDANTNAAQLGETIDDLLNALETTTDSNEKKKIRRRLRAKGHKGGLRLRESDKARATEVTSTDVD